MLNVFFTCIVIYTSWVLKLQMELRYSRLQKSCNKQAEQWKTTIDLLCLIQEEGHAEVGKIIRFICVVNQLWFPLFRCVLQDFCNLLYVTPLSMV